MTASMLATTLFSLLVFAAHCLRGGAWGATAALAVLAAALFTRRAWLRWPAAAALGLGAFVLAAAARDMLLFRLAAGLPWLRMVLIMAAVIAASLLALGLLLGPAGGRWFSRDREWSAPRGAAAVICAALLGIARAKSPFPVLLADRFLPGSGWIEIAAVAAYASFVAGLVREPRAAARLRPRIWGLFSAVFFAQLVLGLVGVPHMLMTGRLHLPVPALIVAGPLYRGDGLFMPILFASSVLLLGPAWCSWLCYIGAWDGNAALLSGKKPRSLPGRLLWLGRGGSLVLAAGAALGLRAAGVQPLAALVPAALFGLAGLYLMLFTSRRLGYMVHCTTFCPMGLVGNLLGRLSPWRMRIAEGCTQCGACSRTCRYGALGPADLARGRPGLSCTLCGDCLPACREQHLGYTLPGVAAPRARAAFLALAVALHAVFLAVARI
ncbi:4Fe-4S ferredoxin iron-sulfur binding domain-containing protein [Desulfovibrio sp. X2]|uniref:4Fe-4S binding protein n=1 Tax=Desulfovibrio sp. X2 TaxID=941449 RepID=UPI000358B7FA|nr:4Fe-4S binding protein [Desulfovibrio sp. X2]EPR37479.1 4Fe-4S ferredoxin iron-sulfur binding domain-containing protein [Desulfovibrio sp. X2]